MISGGSAPFHPEGCGRLSTWLVVVARRLCLDAERQRYGRSRAEAASEPAAAHAGRRRLVQLAGEALDPDRHPATTQIDSLSALCAAEAYDPRCEVYGICNQETLIGAVAANVTTPTRGNIPGVGTYAVELVYVVAKRSGGRSDPSYFSFVP